MNIYLLIISSLFFSTISAQTFSEKVGHKVFVNKKIVSFSYTKIEEKNGVKTSKSNTPSMDNPFDIYIVTTENLSSIRINNKKLRDDIYLKFTGVYKMKYDNSSWIYEFSGNNNCDANITVYDNSKEHQNLYLKSLLTDKKI